MNALAVMQLLATAPLFASRAFLAAFLVAVTARFGHAVPFLADSSALIALRDAPLWFTSDVALVALGVLAVAEAVSERSVDMRQVLAEVGPYLKLGAALAINLGLADAQSAAMLQHLTVDTVTVLHAGVDGSHAVATIAALGTFWLAILRKRSLAFFMDADDGDDLGIVGALVWVEDAFVLGGVAMMAIFPALALALMAATALGLLAFERWTAHRETAALVPCEACGDSLHAGAARCPSCDAPRSASAIGAFGRAKERPAGPRHPQHLLAAGRCSVCATRLGRRSLGAECPRCGRSAFPSLAEAEGYVGAVTRQLPVTLAVCAVLSAIPLLGLVPGIIYYRMSLLGGLRRYLPLTTGVGVRWASRLLTIALLSFQWVPILGAAMLPLLAASNYLLYRRALLGAAREALAPA